MMPNQGPAAKTATGQRKGIARHIVCKSLGTLVLLISPWFLRAMAEDGGAAQTESAVTAMPSDGGAKHEDSNLAAKVAPCKVDAADSLKDAFKSGSWPFQPLARPSVPK